MVRHMVIIINMSGRQRWCSGVVQLTVSAGEARWVGSDHIARISVGSPVSARWIPLVVAAMIAVAARLQEQATRRKNVKNA